MNVTKILALNPNKQTTSFDKNILTGFTLAFPFQAFNRGKREGFFLKSVDNAPLAKRRKLKMTSTGVETRRSSSSSSSSTSSTASNAKAQNQDDDPKLWDQKAADRRTALKWNDGMNSRQVGSFQVSRSMNQMNKYDIYKLSESICSYLEIVAWLSFLIMGKQNTYSWVPLQIYCLSYVCGL